MTWLRRCDKAWRSTSGMSYSTIADLRAHLAGQGQHGSAYAEKMFHPVPDLPTVSDRARYLVEKAKGKIVLDIGCTGVIATRIQAVAVRYYGIDRAEGGDWAKVDVDRLPGEMPTFPDVNLIIVSELLEHLANPGSFLEALHTKYPTVPLYVTVPHAGAYTVQGKCEVVNREHVAWYSYTTLKTLLGRYGYAIQEARWYNGEPHKAEGLIVLVR